MRERREAMKISQKDLAELSKVPVRTLARIEKTGKLTADKARLLAVPLKTSITYLLGETDDPAPPFSEAGKSETINDNSKESPLTTQQIIELGYIVVKCKETEVWLPPTPASYEYLMKMELARSDFNVGSPPQPRSLKKVGL